MSFILIFMVAPAAFARATDAKIYRTPWEPLETVAFNNCNGEDIAFTGKTFTELQVTEDGSGGQHNVLILRTRGTGVGLVTDSKYVTNEGGSVIEIDTNVGATAFTVTFKGTLISLDRDVPDLHYSLRLHATIDPNDNLTSSIDRFEVCGEAL